MRPCKRRSLYRERGLKCCSLPHRLENLQSLPLPGAWIEIEMQELKEDVKESLPLPGAWIEIETTQYAQLSTSRRSLYRERGLKFLRQRQVRRVPCRSLYRERGLKYKNKR